MRKLSVLILLFVLSGTAAAKEPITIYLAGDSTMAHKLPEKRPEAGRVWPLKEFVNYTWVWQSI